MLSTFIKKLRKEHNLSQEFIAGKLDVSRPSYIQIEAGNKELTIRQAKILSDVYNLSLENFLKEDNTSVSFSIEKKKTVKKIVVPKERVDKFKETLLYLISKVGGNPNVTMTTIYKLLYFIDLDYYEKYKEELMGLTYVKNNHGPTPVLFEKVIDKLIKDQEVEVIKSKFYEYPNQKYLINPEVIPNLYLLNGREIEHINYEIERFKDITENKFQNLLELDVPWVSTKEGNIVDYSLSLNRTIETSVKK